MMDLDTARDLAMALLIMERRPMVALDDEVRVALGMRARRGRFRLDDLQLRLVQLVISSDLWRARGEAARRRVITAPAVRAGGKGARCKVA